MIDENDVMFDDDIIRATLAVFPCHTMMRLFDVLCNEIKRVADDDDCGQARMGRHHSCCQHHTTWRRRTAEQQHPVTVTGQHSRQCVVVVPLPLCPQHASQHDYFPTDRHDTSSLATHLPTYTPTSTHTCTGAQRFIDVGTKLHAEQINDVCVKV